MIIGFLGKGGSGKSTLSTMLVQQALASGMRVHAIDADHNMDLTFNLAQRELPAPYLGDAFWEIRRHFGLQDHEEFSAQHNSDIRFSLTEPDAFTASYQHTLSPQLSLMLTGPQTDEVLHGKRCSHSLASALKLYLPYLHVNENELVVVDEKASVDAASTGIPTGFDLGVIVLEPRPQSIRVGEQIASVLSAYDVPYVFVLNKAETHILENLAMPEILLRVTNLTDDLTPLIAHARTQSSANTARRERSQKKFAAAQSFAPNTP